MWKQVQLQLATKECVSKKIDIHNSLDFRLIKRSIAGTMRLVNADNLEVMMRGGGHGVKYLNEPIDNFNNFLLPRSVIMN